MGGSGESLVRLARAGLFALIASVLPVCAWADAQSPNVIIFVIDGVAYSETFGDPAHAHIPHIWNDLRPQGTIHTAFYNRGETFTLGAHATILTGTNTYLGWPEGEELFQPFTPTLFEYFRAFTGAEKTQAWMAWNVGMKVLAGMSVSTHPLYGMDYAASCRGTTGDNMALARELESLLDEYHPRLVLINFHESDAWGHLGEWDEYIRALEVADKIVYGLWQKLQSDPFYADRTTLIVTADHGRHVNDWTSHGDCCDGCQPVFFLLLGPTVQQGLEVSGPERNFTDIGVTAGWLMGMPMPYAVDGVVMADLFTGGEPVPPPPSSELVGLGIEVVTVDTEGLPCSVFEPGAQIGLQGVIRNQGSLPARVYEVVDTWGTWCNRGKGFPSGFRLDPLASADGVIYRHLPWVTPSGTYPITIECRGIEQGSGAVVGGSTEVTITVEVP